MRRSLRKLLHEPLLHFVVLGAGLFALDAALAERGQPVATATAAIERRIVIDADVRGELAKAFRRAEKRPPSESELSELVQGWIDRQILYREGCARGLDRDDPRIEQRVADKMAFVLRSQLTVPEPTEGELERYFREHAERYREDALVDFVHVFVEGHDAAAEARAAELLRKLEEGVEPGGLGDTFTGGRRYRRRKLDDLAERFGEEFAAGIRAQADGRWAVQRSRFGVHLVRIEGRTEARESDWSRARPLVLRDWQDEQRARQQARLMEELRSQWRIEHR